MFVDDNGTSLFVDDNGVDLFVDDNGIYLGPRLFTITLV